MIVTFLHRRNTYVRTRSRAGSYAEVAGLSTSVPESCDFLQQAGGQRGANAGMKDGQPLALDVELVEGVRPKLAPLTVDDRGFVLLGELRNDILEEAGDGMLGRVDGRTVMSGLDDRFTRAIELQDGVVVELHVASRC